MRSFDRHPADGCRAPRARRWTAILIGVLAFLSTAQVAVPRVASELFDATQLLRDLQILSADDMQGRQIGTPGSQKARGYLVERFKGVGLEPVGSSYEHAFTVPARAAARGERQGVNVVGRLQGLRYPNQHIVASAHYDHVGVQNGRIFNGAGDNASGAVALLAVAEYFRRHPPAHSLIVAAFDGEEVGLAGSRAFVRSPPLDRATIAMNINADMLGRDPSNQVFVVGVRRQPHLRASVERVAAVAPVKLTMGHEDPREPEDWTERADHFAFMEAGIPALFLGVEDFPFYHRPTDDFETIDQAFFVRAVETVILMIKEFDVALRTLPARP